MIQSPYNQDILFITNFFYGLRSVCEECCLEGCASAINTRGPTASTSGEYSLHTNNTSSQDQSDRNNNNSAVKNEFDNLNENGIVRMDMSKIIDATGLPTYDAALKLESCGYV